MVKMLFSVFHKKQLLCYYLFLFSEKSINIAFIVVKSA
jgi:hypothetical protein